MHEEVTSVKNNASGHAMVAGIAVAHSYMTHGYIKYR